MDSSTQTFCRSPNRPFSLRSRKASPKATSNPVPSPSAKQQRACQSSTSRVTMIISQRTNLNQRRQRHQRQEQQQQQKQKYGCDSVGRASLLASELKKSPKKQSTSNVQKRFKRSMSIHTFVCLNILLLGTTIGTLLFPFVPMARASQNQGDLDSKQLTDSTSSLYGYRLTSSNDESNSNQASDIDTVRVLEIKQPSPAKSYVPTSSMSSSGYPSAKSNSLINLIGNSASTTAYNQSEQHKPTLVYTNGGIQSWPAPMSATADGTNLHLSSYALANNNEKPATTIIESRSLNNDAIDKQAHNIVVHSLITVHTTKKATPSTGHNADHRKNIVTNIFHQSPLNPSAIQQADNIGLANIEAPPTIASGKPLSSQLSAIDTNPSATSYAATQSSTSTDNRDLGLKYEYFPSFYLKPSSSAVSTYDVTRTLADAVAAANKIDLLSPRQRSNSRRRPNNKNNNYSQQQTARHRQLNHSHPFYKKHRGHRYYSRDSTSDMVSHSNDQQHYPSANTRRQSSYSVSDQCALLLERMVDANSLIQGVGSGLQLSSASGISHQRPASAAGYLGNYRYYNYRAAGSDPSATATMWNGQGRRVKRHHQDNRDSSQTEPPVKKDKSKKLLVSVKDWSSKIRVSSPSSKNYAVANSSISEGQVTDADKNISAPEGNAVDPMMASASVVEGVVNQVCITFDHVDEALEEAKRELEFQMPDDLDEAEPSDGTLNVIGELNQLVTEILANRFDLSSDEILNGLPMIDIKQTRMWSLCPTSARQIECMPNNRYRSITGHCNNLNYPTMGAANTPFVRYVPSDYADGVSEPRVSSVDLSELPSARAVVSLVHQDYDRPSSELSLLIMSWGQLVDHDLALATPPSESSGHNLKCCPNNDHSLCLPIRVAPDDPKYAQHNIQCLEFKRSLAGVRPNCVLGPRAQLNAITSAIDANFIYGTNVEDARDLRAYSGGRMRTWNYFSEEGLKPLLPPQRQDPDVDCVNRPSDLYCFIAGDVRVNEQTQLTSLHIMHVREHNRIASILESLNGHWSDERIYQETRHIIAAMLQHIILAEYLPALIGPDICAQYNLTEAITYWDHYDPDVNIGISNEFSTAAFRQGHTFVQGVVRRYNSRHQLVGTHQLRNLFRQPWPLFQPGALDEFVLGLVNTPAQSFDPFMAEDISGHLFQRPGSQVGFDLPSINIQRAREQGVPGYNTFREWCGLPRAYSFMDLQPYLSNFTAYQYSLLYKHVDDIDLFSGGLSEQRLPGAQVGPTFACIIARQFSNLRRGDRFWFENSMMPSSFTPEQLIEIKKTSLARILCSNSDYIQDIQRSAFHLPHPIFNERIPCAMLPDIDFRYWQEGL